MAQDSSFMPGMKNLDPDARRLAQSSVTKPSGKIFMRVIGYAGRQKKYMLFIILLAAAGCTLDILAPYYVGLAIDDMKPFEGQVNLEHIFSIVIVLVIFYLCSSFFIWILNYLSSIVATNVAAQLRRDGFAKIGKMPLSFFDTRSHGDILSRFVNDVDAVSDGLLQGLVQLFSSGITLAGAFIFMTFISRKMLVIVIPAAILTFIIASQIMRFTSRYFKGQQTALGELSGLAEETFSAHREVKAFQYEANVQKQFEKINQELYIAGQKAQFASSLPNPTTRFVNNLAYILIGVFGWFFGGLTPGQITSFVAYWKQFSKPLNDFTNISSQIMAAFAAAGRIFSILDMKPEPADPDTAVELKNSKGAFSFRNVFFSYVPEKPLIRDFSLEAQPGQRVAVVGPTGAGKTTIINLLMRFYEPDSGEIRLDGRNIQDISRESLRRAFGMVLQETWLFAGSIRDNLLYGCPEITEEEMIEACKTVHAHSFISRMENGYDTIILENGGNLSAGQKQLLTIVRAMLAKPDMLILDEATSSVDTLTEIRIQEAFALLMQNRTSFVIAHRLSTIKNADLILVMCDGQVIEQGTHKILLEKNGFYHELYNSQFSHETEAVNI